MSISFGLTAHVGWLGLRVGSHSAMFYIHQMNRVNSRNDLCHDDSTINIDKSIIIIIITCTTYTLKCSLRSSSAKNKKLQHRHRIMSPSSSAWSSVICCCSWCVCRAWNLHLWHLSFTRSTSDARIAVAKTQLGTGTWMTKYPNHDQLRWYLDTT